MTTIKVGSFLYRLTIKVKGDDGSAPDFSRLAEMAQFIGQVSGWIFEEVDGYAACTAYNQNNGVIISLPDGNWISLKNGMFPSTSMSTGTFRMDTGERSKLWLARENRFFRSA